MDCSRLIQTALIVFVAFLFGVLLPLWTRKDTGGCRALANAAASTNRPQVGSDH